MKAICVVPVPERELVLVVVERVPSGGFVGLDRTWVAAVGRVKGG